MLISFIEFYENYFSIFLIFRIFKNTNFVIKNKVNFYEIFQMYHFIKKIKDYI